MIYPETCLLPWIIQVWEFKHAWKQNWEACYGDSGCCWIEGSMFLRQLVGQLCMCGRMIYPTYLTLGYTNLDSQISDMMYFPSLDS